MEEMSAQDKNASSEYEAFERLERLLAVLPDMEEKSARMVKATLAEEVVAIHRRYEANRKELEKLDSQLAEATQAIEKASMDTSDDATLEALNRNRLYYAAMRGFKIGPVQNDSEALEQALLSGGFASVDEAQAALLTSQELVDLTNEVQQYQNDYAQTLALCQEIEEGVGDNARS